VEGFLAGLLIVWTIALWIFGATAESAVTINVRPAGAETTIMHNTGEPSGGSNAMRTDIA
jgi:hypothetical protein